MHLLQQQHCKVVLQAAAEPVKAAPATLVFMSHYEFDNICALWSPSTERICCFKNSASLCCRLVQSWPRHQQVLLSCIKTGLMTTSLRVLPALSAFAAATTNASFFCRLLQSQPRMHQQLLWSWVKMSSMMPWSPPQRRAAFHPHHHSKLYQVSRPYFQAASSPSFCLSHCSM